jgi:hypothetical protein
MTQSGEGHGVRRTILLLTATALALILAAAMANELSAPAIDSVPVPGDAPLTLRFAVVNHAYLAAIHDIDFTCVPDQVKGRDAGGAAVRVHGVPFPMNVDIDLGPRASFQYTCPIQGPHLPAEVDRIEAHVELAYTSLGRRLHAHSAELIWDGQSRIWTKAPDK